MEQQMKFAAKQMVSFQKMMFDGMVNSMIMFWDQTEKMFAPFVEQAVWVPPEGKGAFKEWITRSKKNCESFRDAAGEGFDWLEGFLAGRER